MSYRYTCTSVLEVLHDIVYTCAWLLPLGRRRFLLGRRREEGTGDVLRDHDVSVENDEEEDRHGSAASSIGVEAQGPEVVVEVHLSHGGCHEPRDDAVLWHG